MPDMLVQESGLCTGTAFDNYDELTETLSGKDTLHDTVGICYQNKTQSVPLCQIYTNNNEKNKRKGNYKRRHHLTHANEGGGSMIHQVGK